jgi:hypothetical protein
VLGGGALASDPSATLFDAVTRAGGRAVDENNRLTRWRASAQGGQFTLDVFAICALVAVTEPAEP